MSAPRFEPGSFSRAAVKLDREYEDEDIRFACDLMWTGESTIHRFRLRVSRHSPAAPDRS